MRFEEDNRKIFSSILKRSLEICWDDFVDIFIEELERNYIAKDEYDRKILFILETISRQLSDNYDGDYAVDANGERIRTGDTLWLVSDGTKFTAGEIKLDDNEESPQYIIYWKETEDAAIKIFSKALEVTHRNPAWKEF